MSLIISEEAKEWIKQQNELSYYEQWARRRGFDSNSSYNDYLAQRKGFKNHSDEIQHRRHITGKNIPMNENKACASYLGVVVAERVLSRVFEEVERMPHSNSGYDFVCSKGYKIDVKSSVLCKSVLYHFDIRKNTVADYFLLLAFDNREKLNPKHLWLIKGNEIIRGRQLNSFKSLSITHPEEFSEFSQHDKLEKLEACCNSLR